MVEPSVNPLGREQDIRYIDDYSKTEDAVTTTDREDPAERFPDDINIDIQIHPGSYLIRDKDALENRLRRTIQREWVILADGLGIPLRDIPIRTAHFWAPVRSEEEIREIEKTAGTRLLKMREQFHRMRISEQLDQDLGTIEYRRSTKSLIHLALGTDAKVEDGAVVHD